MSTYDHPSTDTGRPLALHTTPSETSSSAWAWAGVLAGVLGLVTFVLSPMVVKDWTDELMADNGLLAGAIIDSEWIVWASQVLASATAGLLVVFGAGLRRRLAAQEPVGSLLPTVAFSGTLLTSAMCLVGGGISTELFWSLTQDLGKSDPDTLAANLAIFNTMLWVWAGIGLSAGAVAVAALRHGSVQRWIGWVSVVFTVLVLASQVLPLQYIALLPGSVWLVIAGVGLGRRERIG